MQLRLVFFIIFKILPCVRLFPVPKPFTGTALHIPLMFCICIFQIKVIQAVDCIRQLVLSIVEELLRMKKHLKQVSLIYSVCHKQLVLSAKIRKLNFSTNSSIKQKGVQIVPCTPKNNINMITQHNYGKSYAIGIGKGFAPYLGTLRLRHSKKV